MQRERHGVVGAGRQGEDQQPAEEAERAQGPPGTPPHIRFVSQIKMMSSHRTRVFSARLWFTACACALAIGAVRADEPPAISIDNDGTFAFRAATFVQPAGWPLITGAQRASEHIGPGVEFERWRLSSAAGPLTLSIARVDLRDPRVALAVGTRYDRIVGPGEPLSTMADRRAAEIGINADYFDISGGGEPTNLVLANGIVQHAPNGRAVLLVGDGNLIAMGPVTWKMQLIAANGTSMNVDAINDWTHGSRLMLFTQSFGMPGQADAAAELSLAPTADGRYQVLRSESDALTFLPLRPSDLGVAARGDAAVTLLQQFHEGDVVTLTQTLAPQLPGMREGVGGGPLLLRDGALYDDPDSPSPEERDVRYPLTGAGTSADGATLWLVTVDGRAPARSVGITRPMFASLFSALGAATAMAFDSGGSTEMVARRLGDPHVSVANVPSDGRERSVADGLFVLNSATPGPPQTLVLRAPAPAVLAGSHIAVAAQSVDANDQPVPTDGAVAYSVSPASAAVISPQGMFTARAAGGVTVTARSAQASGELHLDVVSRVDELRIAGVQRVYPPGATFALSVQAARADGSAIAIDPDAIAWSSSGDGGSVDAQGAFKSSGVPSRADVVARAGGARATATLLIGAHEVGLGGAMLPGDGAGRWHLTTVPKDLAAALDAAKAPDGSPALHLSFDFGDQRATRAAFIENDVPLPGEPLVVSVDAYGDGSGAWLRIGYRNGDGVSDSMTLARHITWKGWRNVRAEVPPQARWPIALTKIYLVAPPSEHYAGDLWLRDLGVWYAGPRPPGSVALTRARD
ncbi:MAG TPA: phosphodiester glycosidase family protein [Candidatus Eremiobacteraceae bacterium]|nr:phosphodiester glycosidase family protein [Candidatus Eremiobacteraceae bacterium]